MAKDEEPKNYKNNHKLKTAQEWAMKRLPKRLAYVLRYGVLKEGLEANDNGYVELDKLLDISLLQDYTREEVFNTIKTSVGHRVIHRYNWLEKDGKVYVRAAYLRNFEKSPCHPGTKVYTLFECALTQILEHLDDYDLQDFPDEHIIKIMILRLKIQKKLSVKALKTLLVPTITHLNLEDVFLTSNVLRTVWTQCPDLSAVSLKNCGYIITDTTLAQFTKNLPKLQCLNLCNCNHLTSKCLKILSKQLPHLQTLHIARVPSLTYESVLDFIKSSKELQFLDVYYLKTAPEEYNSLMEVAKERGLNLVLREPRKKADEELLDNEKEEKEITPDGDDDSSYEGSQVEYDTADDLWGKDAANVWYEGHDNVYMTESSESAT